MKNTRTALLMVCILALGYGIGVFTASQREVSSPSSIVDSKHRQNLQQMLDHNYQDYLRLQNLEDRYQKADEILGKIMQIFLADLGLHIAPDLKAAMLDRSPSPKTTSTPPLPSGSASSSAASVAQAPPRLDSFFMTVDDPGKADDLLKSMKSNDFKKIWIGSDFLKQTPFHLNGCYEGRGQVHDPDDLWNIQVFHQFTQGAAGVESITITSPRGMDSRTRGKGSNAHIRGIDDKPDAVLLEADPDIVFQLFYISGNDTWVGNIYEKQKKDDSFKAIGTLELRHGDHCSSEDNAMGIKK